jgi:UDP-GlcNAc:undecaprenyl-phosphate GlcNAc-1-phosphate transferase
MPKYLILFSISLALSFLLTPGVRWVAMRWRIFDLPDPRKIHRRPVPLLGGMALFCAFHLTFFLSLRLDFFAFPENFIERINYTHFFLASAIVFGMGAADDFWHLSPLWKLLCQGISGLIISFTPFRIEEISFPFGSYSLGMAAIPFTILWVITISNALNLLDGLDGLAAGITFIAALSIFAVSLLNENTGAALFSMILAGTTLGFLRYNYHPASIFLGNCGSYFLGFVLSVLSLQSHAKNTTAIVMLFPFLLLGLPILDTSLSVLRRFLKTLRVVEIQGVHRGIQYFFQDKWSLFRADREHIHHRLLQLGFTHSRAVVFLYLVSIVLGFLAFSSVYFTNWNQALLLLAVGLSTFIGIRRLQYSDIQVLRNGTLLPLFHAPWIGQRIVKSFLDLSSIGLAYYLAIYLRYGGEVDWAARSHFLATFPLVTAVKMAVFALSGLYRGSWAFTGIPDLRKTMRAVFLSSLAAAALVFMIPGLEGIGWTVWVIDFHLLFFFMIFLRSALPILEYLYETNPQKKKRVLIYGVGQMGQLALKEFLHNPRLNLDPIGFIDEDEETPRQGREQYPLLGSLDSLEKIFQTWAIDEVVVSQNHVPADKLARLAAICRNYQVSLRRFQGRKPATPPAF